MLTSSSIAFLKRLLDAPGPSGYEGPAARTWRAEAETFADHVTCDVAGNSFAEVNPKGSPTILLDGHIDEIGLIVQYIDDDGYLYVDSIGGWDPEVLVGQRLRFLTPKGDVTGVVGKKPIHLIKRAEREKASKLTDLWVDIGAASRAEAEARVGVGDAAVIDAPALDFPNDRVVSRAIDDRIGAFTVLEALRRYKKKPGKARVVAAATTQEEIGSQGGGALVAANRVNPQMAIAVDVTFATDHPGLEKKELGDHKMGSGPVLVRGSLISPVVFDLLRRAADAGAIPHTLHAEGRATFTNADAIHLAREGVATALVSIPNRYMHSPVEMVSLVDVHHTATLIHEACRGVDDRTDFTAR
ncbi:MAG TPA: M20/M25/M40 family metallo-hydrolase [Gemmatimonadaceae bacterium]|jgi:endoglucanase|nr:M20/M25/M40 family metallo-hydrolase [Gemmatimonadaceae bacterium]